MCVCSVLQHVAACCSVVRVLQWGKYLILAGVLEWQGSTSVHVCVNLNVFVVSGGGWVDGGVSVYLFAKTFFCIGTVAGHRRCECVNIYTYGCLYVWACMWGCVCVRVYMWV